MRHTDTVTRRRQEHASWRNTDVNDVRCRERLKFQPLQHGGVQPGQPGGTVRADRDVEGVTADSQSRSQHAAGPARRFRWRVCGEMNRMNRRACRSRFLPRRSAKVWLEWGPVNAVLCSGRTELQAPPGAPATPYSVLMLVRASVHHAFPL